MGQTRRVSGVATSIRREDGYTKVRYHDTDVVCFNSEYIILDSGGWQTATTKTRMNQASNQFGLLLSVYQSKGDWYVLLRGDPNNPVTFNFRDGMVINRKNRCLLDPSSGEPT